VVSAVSSPQAAATRASTVRRLAITSQPLFIRSSLVLTERARPVPAGR
jgi:hypothetical protein